MDELPNKPPKFPERALASKAILYSQLQDIDIYVEDEGSEAFYTELLKRLVGKDVKIAKVIPLRGRNNVVNKAVKYNNSRPALFLIDGDLQWIAGISLPENKNLYIHPCYCVENYLFCENAMIQLIVENSGAMNEGDAKIFLDWESVRSRIEKLLVPLFIEFAVAFALCPDIKTVKRGISCLLRDSRKKSPPEIDESKIAAVQKEVKDAVIERTGEENYKITYSKISNRVKFLMNPIDVVSGKDYLIPIQMFTVNRAGNQKMIKKSFVFRLARHCTLSKLDDLRNKIIEIVE